MGSDFLFALVTFTQGNKLGKSFLRSCLFLIYRFVALSKAHISFDFLHFQNTLQPVDKSIQR